jgi:hypothetical protein
MKHPLLLAITGFLCAQCFGQTDSSETKANLTLGVVYSNNANYYGQRAAANMPYAAAAANYKFRSGIYFTGMAYKLLNDTGGLVSASNLGAGIAFKLSKLLGLDLSYSHTFYPTYSPFLQAANPDNASAGFTYTNWLSSSVNVDYAFGKTKDLFVTLGIGKSINLGSIGRKDIITITPAFDVVGGTQHFYQTYITEKRLRDSLFGLLLPPLTGDPSSGGSTTTTTSTEFNLLSYNFKFPIAYNRTHYMLEAACQVSVLGRKAESGAGKTNTFVSFSFYYQF